jgi:quercetin dioxygenase-like cupin family protein
MTCASLVLCLRLAVATAISTAIALGPAPRSRQQEAQTPSPRARPDGMPRGCLTPVSERKMEAGCYTTAETPLGLLPSGPLFWHLYAFPSRAAAETARAAGGTVIDSHGKHWLFTIAAEGWRPAAGEKVATIGPLLVATDKPYTARYMEAVFPPGSQPVGGPGHRHPGPEAWYVLTGAQCLETPNGVIRASAGETTVVPEGVPMAISDAGKETRRTVVLILHVSSEPPGFSLDDPRSSGAPHSHWRPLGLCGQ